MRIGLAYWRAYFKAIEHEYSRKTSIPFPKRLMFERWKARYRAGILVHPSTEATILSAMAIVRDTHILLGDTSGPLSPATIRGKIVQNVRERTEPFTSSDVAKAVDCSAGYVHTVLSKSFKGILLYRYQSTKKPVKIFAPLAWDVETFKKWGEAQTKSGISNAKIRYME